MNVLIAFDGSPSARAAVARSGELFAGADADVVSVAVGLDALKDAGSSARTSLPDEVIRKATEHLLSSALTESRELSEEGARLAAEAGFAAAHGHPCAAEGAPWATLLRAAREASADAIVCGTHGHGPVAGAILGSVSYGIVRHSPVPVLVVREGAKAATGPLVIGYDGSDPSRRAIEACGRLMPGRATLVVYVSSSPLRHHPVALAMRHAPVDDVRESIEELDDMFDQWANEDAEAGAAIAREHTLDARAQGVESWGSAAAGILDVAAEAGACAIAVGRRGRGAVASAVLGSVSASLLHAADRPVLVT